MRQRLWEHLLDTHAIQPDRPETWTVHTPAHFQKLTGTGDFDAMATDELCAVIDDLLGAGRWQRPAHWGRPLVTFPRPDTAWDVPASDWHLDTQDVDELRMVVVFAHLAPVLPRGGGTLVITGSHRLTTPAGLQADNAPVRSGDVKAYLRTLHPWLRDLWIADSDTDRIHRYMEAGAVIDGVRERGPESIKVQQCLVDVEDDGRSLGHRGPFAGWGDRRHSPSPIIAWRAVRAQTDESRLTEHLTQAAKGLLVVSDRVR